MARRTHAEVVRDNNERTSRLYDACTDYSLTEVYGRYSTAKAAADDWCREKMVNMNGWGYKVTSHNTNFFTVMWLFENPETGHLQIQEETAYHSRTYDYI